MSLRKVQMPIDNNLLKSLDSKRINKLHNCSIKKQNYIPLNNSRAIIIFPSKTLKWLCTLKIFKTIQKYY